MYRLTFTKNALKTLAHMPKDASALVRQKLLQLAQNPYAPNPNATKLQNRPGYRLRIGDWRIIYEIENEAIVIIVLTIGQRKEVYR